MTDTEDKSLIQERIKSLEESVEYFSSKNKTGREIWVAKSFIKNLNIPFQESEFQSPEQDPPDVIFREANFEVKEILDPSRRRHEEYKKKLEKARTMKSTQELLHQFTPIDKTITDIYELCLEATEALTKYPSSVRSTTDLLYYVNLLEVWGISETPFPDTKKLINLGWRSVSFVMGYRSCVFVANNDAPSFIIKAAHPIHHRENSEYIDN